MAHQSDLISENIEQYLNGSTRQRLELLKGLEENCRLY